MTIRHAIYLINALFVLLVIVLAGFSYNSSRDYSAILAYVTGPAWDSADGAMEGTIGLQQQIIAINLLQDRPDDKNHAMELLNEGKAMANEALGRMLAAGLMSPANVSELKQQQNNFERARESLLENLADPERLKTFENTTSSLLVYLEKMEEEGDSKVENQFTIIESLNSSTVRLNLILTVLGLSLALGTTWFARRMVLVPLQQLATNLKDLASGQGNLTVRLASDLHNEFDDIAQSFNQFVDKIARLVREVKLSNEEVAQVSSTISNTIGTATQGVAVQQAETERVVAAISQMSSVLHALADQASGASENAHVTKTSMQAGVDSVQGVEKVIQRVHDLVAQANAQINQVQQDSAGIVQMLEMIRNIADQTNLLALNAAIEAARAGESGRGFAVVAEEVRNLATRTQSSTGMIEQDIQKLTSSLQHAVVAMQQVNVESDMVADQTVKTLQTLAHVSNQLDLMNRLNDQVADSTQQQGQAIADLSESMQRIRQQGQHTESQSQHAKQSMHTLTEHIEQLSEQLNQFKC